MICPVCIANAALAVAGAATSGGATAMALRILRRKAGVKQKAERECLRFLPPPARDRQDREARSERHG